MENMSFFEEDYTKTLNIICDGKTVDMSIEDIFSNKYEHFIGVTYSISSSFINKYLKGFDTCDVVIGIDNDNIKNSVNEMAKHFKDNIHSILKGDSIKLYNELEEDVKKCLKKQTLNIKVSNTHIIHSKFYLMWNDKETRLIVGSANLSNIAFDTKSNQFENILIFDNNPMFDIYKKYYDDSLSKVLTDYIPKALINYKNIKTKGLDDVDVESVVILDNKDIEKLKEKQIVSTIEDVKDKIAIGVVPESLVKEIANISDDRRLYENSKKEDKKLENIAFEIVKESVNTKKEIPNFKTRQTITKNVNKKIIKIISKENDVREDLKRNKIIYDKSYRNLSKGITGMFSYSSLNDKEAIPFGKKATDDEIKSSLLLINEYIGSFENYADKYTNDYGKRIFETILSVFTSPFVYELRENVSIEEDRLDIPQIYILGGNAHSGKSSLLSVLSKLVRGYDGEIYDWKDLEGSQSQKNMQRLYLLYNLMSENNVNPILVDEIDQTFFENEKYGVDFVKNISNESIRSDNAYPCLFATTNSKNFNFPLEARRRLYYLLINKEIHKSQESRLFYEDFYNRIDNKLFLDFCYRMSERLDSAEDYKWDIYDNDVGFDFLYNTRDIFKSYYKSLNLPIPVYFPEKKYLDDTYKNKEMWRILFEGQRENFKYNVKKNALYFDMNFLKENYKDYKNMSLDKKYKMALPSEVYSGDIEDSILIEFIPEKFFDWINVENPYKNKIRNVFNRFIK